MKNLLCSGAAAFGLMLALTPPLPAADLPPPVINPQSVMALSNGLKTSAPVTTYPTTAFIPGQARDQGWTMSFQVPAGGAPSSCGLLTLRVIKAAKRPSVSEAFEVYLLHGTTVETAPVTSSPDFLGSTVPQYPFNFGLLRMVLTSPQPFLLPGQTVTFLVVPVGDGAKCPPAGLFDAPQLHVLPEDYSFDDYMHPLWLGTHTVDESAIFFRNQPTGAAEAKLLDHPRRVERVYSFSSGKSYAEGADWKLTDHGTLVAPPGSTLKTTDDAELHPAVAAPGTRTFKTNDGRLLTSSEEIWNYDRDLWITYDHDADWQGPVPALAETDLPKTLAKLRAKQPVKIVVFGDSISVGACATAFPVLPPCLPPWPCLVARELREHYQAPVTMVNRSLGGMIARWGMDNAAALVKPEAPDLCIIGFGMNDRGAQVPTDTFMQQMNAIMATVREGNPNVEFILVSSARNNPDWGPQQPLLDYREAMLKLQGPGLAVADVTAIHEALMKKKLFIDMSGNNVNHPNDYLVRWYAQVISALLVPPPAAP